MVPKSKDQPPPVKEAASAYHKMEIQYRIRVSIRRTKRFLLERRFFPEYERLQKTGKKTPSAECILSSWFINNPKDAVAQYIDQNHPRTPYTLGSEDGAMKPPSPG